MAVKNYEQLISQAEVIRDETTNGANTAERLGTMLVDVIDSTKIDAKTLLFFEDDKSKLIASCNGLPLENVALQVVYYNRRFKEWRPASGAGVKPVGVLGTTSTLNSLQVALTDVNLVRCKKQLIADVTVFDLDSDSTVTTLFNEIFKPFAYLKRYSFTSNIPIENPFGYVNNLIVHNASATKNNFHKYSLLKTGLAITKSFPTTAGNTKTVIMSNVIKFNMCASLTLSDIGVSFKRKKFTRTI